tara:strand:- start:352 stop:519 length:168 start_codon:yes stop_codon:yes gene_type:complete
MEKVKVKVLKETKEVFIVHECMGGNSYLVTETKPEKGQQVQRMFHIFKEDIIYGE